MEFKAYHDNLVATAMRPCWVKLERGGTSNQKGKPIIQAKGHNKSFHGLTCDKNFTTSCYFRVHMTNHTGEKPFQCEHCGKAFAQRRQVQAHAKFVHANPQLDPDTGVRITPFQCPVCNKYLSTRTCYKNHVNSHTNQKPHKCHYCPARYATHSGRNWHMMSVHDWNRQVHQCNTCKKTFKCGSNLRRHERIHTGTVEARKTFKCEHCDKGFTYVGHLKEHIRVHTGEKNHVCQLCGKGFHIKGNLRMHVNQIHTKERPYECRFCGKRCTQMSQWKTHEKTHADGKLHKCPICDKTFMSKSTVSYQLKAQHTNKIFKCTDCNKEFRSYNGLWGHRINVHGYEKQKKN